MFVVGIDAGGTKTKFSLFDFNGNEIDNIILKSCHFMQVSYLEMEEILKEGIFSLINKHNIKKFYVCAGMAGYGRDKNIRKKIEKVYKNILLNNNFSLYSDAEIAVAGALGENDGIVMIAGTGSIAFSKIKNTFNRCGGWGYLLGDEGSSYWIAKKTLSIFCKQADNRYEKQALYYLIMEKFNLKNDYDLIYFAAENLNDRASISKLSKIAYEAALKNDKYVLKLFDEVSLEIAETINCLNVKKEIELKVSYIGGVFNSKDILFPLLIEKLDKNLTLVEPLFSPEKGAYILYKSKEV